MVENPDVLERMGKNAIELVRREYGLEVVANKLLKAYEACIRLQDDSQ